MQSAIERTRQAMSKDDVQAIKQATSDLRVAAQSLAQYIQQGAGGPQPSGDGPGGAKGGKDDVIDAEFEVKK